MPDDLSGIRFGRIPADAVHLCVDMQRLFAEDTDWRTPWMERVAPNVARLCAHRPDRTVFTRFIPAQRPGEGAGTWSRYYRRWASMTLEALGPDMVELIPELAEFAPPARVFDKHVYSPWVEEGLDVMLEGVEALIVSGGRRTSASWRPCWGLWIGATASSSPRTPCAARRTRATTI